MKTQTCHFCAAPAIERCFSCGNLFCGKHGKKNCFTCENSIVAGDPSPDRVAATRQQQSHAAAWWRPQQAENYVPPACYVCKGLTRAICTVCGRHYCAEHAGRNYTCQQCETGTDWSTIFVGGILVVVGIILVLGYLLS